MPRWPKRKPRAGVDEYGRTALWNHAFAGDLEGVKQALASGADLNAGDDVGYTPLNVAIQQKQVEVVKLLLESGADPNRADHDGNVPLWTAVHNWGHDDRIVLLLLHKGADPRIANNYGRSPLNILAGMKGEIAALVAERFSS